MAVAIGFDRSCGAPGQRGYIISFGFGTKCLMTIPVPCLVWDRCENPLPMSRSCGEDRETPQRWHGMFRHHDHHRRSSSARSVETVSLSRCLFVIDSPQIDKKVFHIAPKRAESRKDPSRLVRPSFSPGVYVRGCILAGRGDRRGAGICRGKRKVGKVRYLTPQSIIEVASA